MNYVYPFTNENVTSYGTLYNFDNAKVLSVLGSGDQYFASLLHGAKEVELFDINGLAWDYFILKYYGIMIFSYEEFYDYFVIKGLDDIKYFKRLLSYLPVDVANRLVDVYKNYYKLSRLLFSNVINILEDGRAIPYFDKEKYYQLQSILQLRNLPTFYLSDFVKLPMIVSNKSYDIILTSNIFDWLYKDYEIESVSRYKELLDKFNYSEIQALYCWNNLDNELEVEWIRNGFEIEKVPSCSALSLTNYNLVLSLRKSK